MHFQLFSDYPAWFWFICILCGVIYAAALYIKERKINEAISSKWWKGTLLCLRFFAVSLIAFLLLNPYLKSRINNTEKPIIVIAQDNSASIGAALKDSTAYKAGINNLIASLSDNFDVRTYTFGSTVTEGLDGNNFKEKSTDISAALNQIDNLYENLNVGAIILASDGIYNTGSNPAYDKSEIGAPIFTIALGDTVPKKDVRINSVLHNNIVYLNDRFVLNIEIGAIFCNKNNVQIKVSEITGSTTKLVGEQSTNINSDNFIGNQQFQVAADLPGIRHYQIRVSTISGEENLVNNVQDIYVEVLDARQKILILANSPHPDLNAFQLSIEANKNYEVSVQLADDFKGSATGYDLIIMHQLPSIKNPEAQLLSTIKANQIPTLFIVGSQTAINLLNKAQSLVTINGSGQSANEITGVYQPAFNLFNLEEKSVVVIPKLPALSAPYGQYVVSPASEVILNQKIGAVNTKTPLLIFSLTGSDKTAVLCAENIWKWRLYNFVIDNNHDAINDLVSKTIQYLSAKNDKKQFRVSQYKNVLTENEPVILTAELYNDSYQLINDPDATVTIKREDGKDYPFQFSKTDKSYVLEAGYFPSGNYTYEGKTVYNGKEYKDKGAFSISPMQLESINTTADHQILNQIAVQSGGKMVSENEIARLTDTITNQISAKPVLREVVKTQSIINLKWLCLVIILLLSVEWFVRKFNGGY